MLTTAFVLFGWFVDFLAHSAISSSFSMSAVAVMYVALLTCVSTQPVECVIYACEFLVVILWSKIYSRFNPAARPAVAAAVVPFAVSLCACALHTL